MRSDYNNKSLSSYLDESKFDEHFGNKENQYSVTPVSKDTAVPVEEDEYVVEVKYAVKKSAGPVVEDESSPLTESPVEQYIEEFVEDLNESLLQKTVKESVETKNKVKEEVLFTQTVDSTNDFNHTAYIPCNKKQTVQLENLDKFFTNTNTTSEQHSDSLTDLEQRLATLKASMQLNKNLLNRYMHTTTPGKKKMPPLNKVPVNEKQLKGYKLNDFSQVDSVTFDKSVNNLISDFKQKEREEDLLESDVDSLYDETAFV